MMHFQRKQQWNVTTMRAHLCAKAGNEKVAHDGKLVRRVCPTQAAGPVEEPLSVRRHLEAQHYCAQEQECRHGHEGAWVQFCVAERGEGMRRGGE